VIQLGFVHGEQPVVATRGDHRVDILLRVDVCVDDRWPAVLESGPERLVECLARCDAETPGAERLGEDVELGDSRILRGHSPPVEEGVLPLADQADGLIVEDDDRQVEILTDGDSEFLNCH